MYKLIDRSGILKSDKKAHNHVKWPDTGALKHAIDIAFNTSHLQTKLNRHSDFKNNKLRQNLIYWMVPFDIKTSSNIFYCWTGINSDDKFTASQIISVRNLRKFIFILRKS